MQFSWPLAATILGTLALVLFRKPLAQLLDRTEKVKDWLVAPKQTAQLPPAKTEVVDDQGNIG